MRIYLKKKNLKKLITDINNFYNLSLFVENFNLNKSITRAVKFDFCMYWYTPRRQTFMHLITIKSYKQQVISPGSILIKLLKKPKFYKSNLRGSSNYFLSFKKLILNNAVRFYLLRIKRFTSRQRYLLQQFRLAVRPHIEYLSCFKSYNSYTSRVRRLKRRIWVLVKYK